MHYSLFDNVSSAKTYLDILNVSVGISIAHQPVDIIIKVQCLSPSLMCMHLKMYWMKKLGTQTCISFMNT